MSKKLNLRNKLRNPVMNIPVSVGVSSPADVTPVVQTSCTVEDVQTREREEIKPAPKYDPKVDIEWRIEGGAEEDEAKGFINKRIRRMKSLCSNPIFRWGAEAQGIDVDHWLSLEELD